MCIFSGLMERVVVEIIISAFFCKSRSFLESELITPEAPLSTFRNHLQSLRHLGKIFHCHNFPPENGSYVSPEAHGSASPVRGSVFQIRIPEKYSDCNKNRNLKIFRQIFQHITAASVHNSCEGTDVEPSFSDTISSIFYPVLSGNSFLHLFISPHIADLFLIIVQLFSSHNIFSALFSFSLHSSKIRTAFLIS